MRKVLKILKKVLFIGLGVYAALFAVFFFDLDGKACSMAWSRSCAATMTAWSAATP